MFRALLSQMKANPTREHGFAAFLSYSHARDASFGRQLKIAIEQFGRSWPRARARRLFLDDSNLAIAPDLWSEIEHALSTSRCFLLLASPEAAASVWVDREVQWWLDNRSVDRLYVLLTEGKIIWDDSRQRVDCRTTALPPSLMDAMRREPLWIDLTELRGARQDEQALKWEDRIAEIVSSVDEVPKDAIVGEHIRQGRRTRRIVAGVIGLLSALLIVALIAMTVAYVQSANAQARALQSTARQLVADATGLRDSQPDLARQLLVQAYRIAASDPTTADLVTGALVSSAAIPRVLPGRDLVWEVEFSPDGRLLAIASNAGTVLHDAILGNVVSTLDAQAGSTRTVSFTSDGRLLATGGADGSVRIFDVALPSSPQLVAAFPAGGSIVANVRFVGDSSVLAVGLSNAAFGLWDVSNRAVPRNLAAVPGDALLWDSPLDINPEGSLLATAAPDNAIAIYNIAEPSQPRLHATLAGHQGQVRSVAFAGNGLSLASGSADNTARLWDLTAEGPDASIAVFSGHSFGVSAVALSPDSTTLALGSGEAEIHLWEVGDPFRSRKGATLVGHSDGVRSLAFSPDARTLASAGADGIASLDSPDSNASVRLWPVTGADRTEAAARFPARGRSTPTFTADGHVVAVGQPIALWSIQDPGRPRQLARAPVDAQGELATVFNRGGRWLATGDPLTLRHGSDLTRFGSSTQIDPAIAGTIAIAIDSSDDTVVTGKEDEPYRLWEIDDNLPTTSATLPGGTAVEQGAVFAPSAPLLATIVDEGRVVLWDVTDAQNPRIAAQLPDSQQVTSLAFTSDARHLATGNARGEVAIWDLRNYGAPKLLTAVVRHTGPVTGVAVYPDGTLLASAGEDGAVRLTSIAEPSRLVELTVLQSGGPFDGSRIMFSPDGATLIASSSSSAGVWVMNPQEIAARLCAESPRISTVDWNRYLPDFAYDPPCL